MYSQSGVLFVSGDTLSSLDSTLLVESERHIGKDTLTRRVGLQHAVLCAFHLPHGKISRGPFGVLLGNDVPKTIEDTKEHEADRQT